MRFPSRTTSVMTATRLKVILLKSMYALRIGELIGNVFSRISVILIVTSRYLSFLALRGPAAPGFPSFSVSCSRSQGRPAAHHHLACDRCSLFGQEKRGGRRNFFRLHKTPDRRKTRRSCCGRIEQHRRFRRSRRYDIDGDGRGARAPSPTNVPSR